MQKKIIALAIAGLASSAAFAQSNVTIYGRADLGGMYRNGNSGAVNNVEGKYDIGSGIQAGSRIGFKGVEDLGNGLKAIFEIEYGATIDQGNSNQGGNNGRAAAWTNRHSYVGLTGGFGTAVGGHLDGVRYGVFNAFDPFAGGTVGNFTQMTIQVDRASNAVAYISPKFAGFGVVLAYATALDSVEAAGNGVPGATTVSGTGASAFLTNNDRTLNTIMGTYDNGPISARLDYEQIVPTNAEGKTWVATAAASYDFGAVKVSALYDILRSDEVTAGNLTGGTAVQHAWFVGLKAPVGKFTLKAVGGQLLDKSVKGDEANAWKLGVGADYALSKRTNLYLDYGQIKNQNGAAYQISPAANANGALASPTAGGTAGVYGTYGLDFGIAHNF